MIGLRWRDQNNNRQEKEVEYNEAPPYFYIKQSEREIHRVSFRDFGKSIGIDLVYDNSGDAVNLDGEPLKKVTWFPPKPGYMRTLRKEWKQTYEADVAYHYRYAIDHISEMPEYNL